MFSNFIIKLLNSSSSEKIFSKSFSLKKNLLLIVNIIGITSVFTTSAIGDLIVSNIPVNQSIEINGIIFIK